jgi:hypothetical protein
MSMLDAALDYVRRGWLVFPLHTVDEKGECSCEKRGCSDAGKHPRVRRGLKEASKDPDKVREWFGPDAPPSNIGLVTGEVSGITVLDIDIGPGKFGAESWADAIRDHGEPNTLMATTGSGGTHVVFQYNSAMKTASNVLGKGVDCRNDGGYIVAAPSRHRSGGVYSWVDWSTPLAVVPSHLSRRKETRGRPKKDDPFHVKYTLEQVEDMLGSVPSDDRDLWRNVGIILGREFDRAEKAWELYVAWSAKHGGKKGRNHDEIMHEAFYELSQQSSEKQLSMGTIVKAAIDNGWAPKAGDVPIQNFLFYGPGNNFIYRPTLSQWVAAAVDVVVSPVNDGGNIIKATDWLKANQAVTSMTCEPMLEGDYIRGFDCRDGEVVEVQGAAVFNSYRKPTIELGDEKLAGPFLAHVARLFQKTGDADQFLDYMAHRVQKPWEKPRFALLIAGGQGTGKDTAVEFCCPAIGHWNVANIDPAAFDSAFNEFASATLVRISEAANLHEMSRWAFNERTKVLIAGSPDHCQINPKYGQKYAVRMHCGVIITTNHLSSGIYIPADDRRYDILDTATLAEMDLEKPEDRKEYFSDLWAWFVAGGASHVAALLHARDISKFSASNGQRKTEAHAAVVASSMDTDTWLLDILDDLGNPPGVRQDVIVNKAEANGEKRESIERKVKPAIGRLGYKQLIGKERAGRWKLGKKLTIVYVKNETPRTYDPLTELAVEEKF